MCDRCGLGGRDTQATKLHRPVEMSRKVLCIAFSIVLSSIDRNWVDGGRKAFCMYVANRLCRLIDWL